MNERLHWCIWLCFCSADTGLCTCHNKVLSYLLLFPLLPVWATCDSLKLPQPGWFVPRCPSSSLHLRPPGGSGELAQPADAFKQEEKGQSVQEKELKSVCGRDPSANCAHLDKEDDVAAIVLIIPCWLTCCWDAGALVRPLVAVDISKYPLKPQPK